MDSKSLFSKGSLFIQGPLKAPILYAMRSSQVFAKKRNLEDAGLEQNLEELLLQM